MMFPVIRLSANIQRLSGTQRKFFRTGFRENLKEEKKLKHEPFYNTIYSLAVRTIFRNKLGYFCIFNLLILGFYFLKNFVGLYSPLPSLGVPPPPIPTPVAPKFKVTWQIKRLERRQCLVLTFNVKQFNLKFLAIVLKLSLQLFQIKLSCFRF